MLVTMHKLTSVKAKLAKPQPYAIARFLLGLRPATVLDCSHFAVNASSSRNYIDLRLSASVIAVVVVGALLPIISKCL